MKEFKWVSLLVIVVLLFAVSGCAPAEAPEEPAVEVEAPEEEAPEAEKIELVLWEQSADWRIDAQQATIDDFEAENPNVTIRIESFPFVEYQTKINSSMKAGTAADIVTVVGQWAPPLIEAGLLEPIPEEVITADTLLSDYWPGAASEAIVDGQVYMIPNHITMGTGGLIYNEDLLVEAGITVPPKFETWEEFMEAASQCAKFDEDGVMTQAGYSAHGVIDSFLGTALIMQQGADIIVDGKSAFCDEKGLAALQTYQDIFLKHKADDPEFPGGLDAFPQGRSCMMNIGAWAGKAAEQQNPDLKVVYGDALPSSNADYPPYVQADTQWQFIVPASSEHKEVVWKFLKHYLTPEQFAKRVPFDGEVPSLKEAALEFADDPELDAYVSSAEYALWSGYKVDREKWNTTMNTYLELLARGEITPEDALDGLCEELDMVLAGQ